MRVLRSKMVFQALILQVPEEAFEILLIENCKIQNFSYPELFRSHKIRIIMIAVQEINQINSKIRPPSRIQNNNIQQLILYTA